MFAGSALLTASLAAAKPTFEKDILPVLEASCTSCHGAEREESRLRLDSEAAVRTGGLSGPAVIPKDPEGSPLLRRLLAIDEPAMPFGAEPLSADAIALVREWIDSLDPAARETTSARKHWAYDKNEGRNHSKFIGRDHHPRAFTMWLAGGGIQGGITVGATDELGYNIVEDPIDVHDLHATALHLLGLDHERLTYRFQGRDFRLTDVSGRVVEKLLA